MLGFRVLQGAELEHQVKKGVRTYIKVQVQGTLL